MVMRVDGQREVEERRGAFPPRQMLDLSHDQENNDQCFSKAQNEPGLLSALERSRFS